MLRIRFLTLLTLLCCLTAAAAPALAAEVEGGSVYVEGATLVCGANGELDTGTFEGLDPNEEYKVTISYDSGYYTITGGMSIDGLATAEELAARAEAAAA